MREKFGSQKMIWIMRMDRRNYAKKQHDFVYSERLGVTLPATIVSRKASTDYRISPTLFKEHIDKVQEFETPVWLDDIICVTNETTDEHVKYSLNCKTPSTEQVKRKLSSSTKNKLGRATTLIKVE